MRMIIEFGFDLVTGTAGTVTIFLRRVFRVRIAALNHESFHDPVKNRSNIKSGASQLLKILDRVRRGVRPKLDHHVSFAGFNNGHFVPCVHGTRFLVLFFSCK